MDLHQSKNKMDNKAISKMNKKELYEKCQKQEQEIQKLSLFQEDREDVLNDFDDDNDNLIEENKKLKEKVKELKEENKSYNTIKFKEWTRETFHARILASGETDTSDLNIKTYIKMLESK
mgnify:FL=1|tara:strand:+ start:487 stop:846 length:360 start_codon:yes stop_codon:yes gene_type:complete